MRDPRSPERGAADGAALAAAVVLGALAFLPVLLLRQGEGWRKCTGEALASNPSVPAKDTKFLSDAERIADAAAVPFVPDPARRLGPPPSTGTSAPPPAAAGKVADLSGRVVEGRLSLRWTPAAGSEGTTLRIEGLGSGDPLEREVPADGSSLDLPVPGTSGTVVVRASPAGGTAPEVRVSIPYRIAVEVVRAERACQETGTAILRLRRSYDGKAVEAEFALHEADPVGDLSSFAPGSPVVDFRTDLVLEDVRDLTAPGPFIEVPLFAADGRLQRDGEGRPLTYGRASTVDAGQEIVLRGPNDERRVVPVRSGP